MNLTRPEFCLQFYYLYSILIFNILYFIYSNLILFIWRRFDLRRIQLCCFNLPLQMRLYLRFISYPGLRSLCSLTRGY